MLNSDNIVAEKCGTITIDVFTTDDDSKLFYIKSNNEDVDNISDIVEETLKLY